jgi:hypothetical protein
MTPRVRLIVAAAAFLGWLGWLGYAALDKNRGPVVSRAQAAAATTPVRATVEAGPDDKPGPKATVVEALAAGGPAAGTAIEVVNLPDATGYTGPGDYLLLLTKAHGAEAFRVVGPQPSPGYESNAAAGKPTVYRWSEQVRAQANKLFR